MIIITEYVYTADGVKLKTIHRTAVDGIEAVGSSPELSEQNTHHKDSILYVGAYEISIGLKRCKYNFANGYVDISGAYVQSYNYFTKDHLGNVRHVAYNIPNRKSSILQKNNYYPFGGLHNEEDNRLSQNKLYNGKEYDPMHGLNLYDYSARQYDPAVGQFTSMDPLCEKYYHISPYAYCAGNPVKYVDPDGMDIWELDKQGNVTWKEKSESHQLIALDSKGKRTDKSITVGDRSILDGLAKDRKGTDANYTVTKSAEVGKVFLFAADNSDVEWSLQGLSKNESENYILGTSHESTEVAPNWYKREGYNESDIVFDIHSHPSIKDDVRGASGGDLGQNNLYSDMRGIVNHYNRLASKTPRHYMYHRNTKTLYQYTPWNSSIKLTTFKNYNINIINFWGRKK